MSNVLQAISRLFGRTPKYDPASDPIFSQFQPWTGAAKAGFHAGFLGEMTDVHFIATGSRLFQKIGGTEDAHADRQVAGSYPPFGEEIFEWQALLAAILKVRDRFVMVDAGAGFGRWLVSAVCGLRRRSPMTPFHLVGIEAEPTHFGWMTQHLRNNGIDPAQHQLLHAAVGGESGTAELLFGDDPAAWYGQTLATTFNGQYAREQHRIMTVRCLSLNAILADLQVVDFLDLDIQGAEEQAVATGIDVMTRKVRRAYVGTHAPHTDRIVNGFFASRGWQCVRQFPCLSIADTEFGRIEFNQGIQHWVNPRF